MSPDTVAPEEMLVATTMAKLHDSFAMLQKQYNSLQVQLKDGVEATPAAQRVIDQMIDLITEEIEPAINEAHQSDQEELDAKMQEILDWNADYHGKKALLMDEF